MLALPAGLRVRMGGPEQTCPLLPTTVVAVGHMPVGPRTLAGTPVESLSTEAAEVAEVRARIAAFMEGRAVVFNGAGEAGLPSTDKAWDVRHTQPARRRANLDVISGVAAILKEHPRVRCEVHGETGRANSAPAPLATLLRMHAVRDVGRIMDELARRRAHACLTALVEHGVAESQLFATSKGMGGNLGVHFVPAERPRSSAERPHRMSADEGRLDGAATAAGAAAGTAEQGQAVGVALRVLRGSEAEVFVVLEPEDPSAGSGRPADGMRYAPMAEPLSSLLLGTRSEDTDGDIDVPFRLSPSSHLAEFELPIEFVRPGPNGARVVGDLELTLRAVGERAPGCTLPAAGELIPIRATRDDGGKHRLTWAGHVEALEVVSGGTTHPDGTPQRMATWPGRAGVSARPMADGSGVPSDKLELPLWRLAVETAAPPTRRVAEPAAAVGALQREDDAHASAERGRVVREVRRDTEVRLPPTTVQAAAPPPMAPSAPRAVAPSHQPLHTRAAASEEFEYDDDGDDLAGLDAFLQGR